MMRGAIQSPERVMAMAVLKRLERYGPDGHACFPRGCTFSDIDGVIELGGAFLFLEVKRTGQGISTGQARLLRALADHHTVVIKWINRAGEVTHAIVVEDGVPMYPVPATETGLAEYFTAWALEQA